MGINDESLSKLVVFIDELIGQEDYLWFKEVLIKRLVSTSAGVDSVQLNEIYEYCINLIIKDHASNFYKDFKLSEKKECLVYDFIRMEKFRRNDNFEDFCIAAYQQIECIVNHLCAKTDFYEYFKINKDISPIMLYDRNSKSFYRGGNQSIGKLIFRTKNENGEVNASLLKAPHEWNFLARFRAVIYYYYFNKELKINENEFNKVFVLGNHLYQGRNLNHRGSMPYDNQMNIIDNLKENQHKYYFRFLGFLEDFVSSLNKNI